jgi:hypothetical protein
MQVHVSAAHSGDRRSPPLDEIARTRDPVERAERVEHFFVILGQLLDNALIGDMVVRLTLSDGRTVEGIPVTPASDVAGNDHLGDSGVVRWIDLSGTTVDLADVRQAVIMHPASHVVQPAA